MDPPWRLAGRKPVRGIRINYPTMTVQELKSIPLWRLQREGIIAIWVINRVKMKVCKWLHEQDYVIIKEINWVKITNTQRVHKSIGFMLQHSKETLIIAQAEHAKIDKMSIPTCFRSVNTGNSEKPIEVQKWLEKTIKGPKIEIFARHRNLRKNWISVGMETWPKTHNVVQGERLRRDGPNKEKANKGI